MSLQLDVKATPVGHTRQRLENDVSLGGRQISDLRKGSRFKVGSSAARTGDVLSTNHDLYEKATLSESAAEFLMAAGPYVNAYRKCITLEI
jgi:hypothetical protein